MPQKWRPSLALVVIVVCGALVSVPLFALMAVQLTSNQFVRETEQSLIQQGAIFAQVYAHAFTAQRGPPIGAPLDKEQLEFWSSDIHPARPRLNVRRDPVLPARPQGTPQPDMLDPRHQSLALDVQPLARGARKTTLAGVIFLDHRGFDLYAASSFAALPEVQTALNGDIGATLRTRGDPYEPHPLASLSRDTGYRVFVTYPVIAQNRVIGVVYLSRTPLNLGKFLFQERDTMMIMGASTVVAAILIGVLLLRLMSRPIRALRDESRAIAAGDKPKSTPLAHYGTRELAKLGDSVMRMADTLSLRANEIATYTDHVTHELKSPVTGIVGAAELLEDDTLDPATRAKLLGNIQAEGQRMNTLLARLREIAQVRAMPRGGPGELNHMLPRVKGIKIIAPNDVTVPLSDEHGQIILLHLAQNAHAHGATEMRLEVTDNALLITDNGTGLPPNDVHRVADPFFTTRRDTGGTGMGLAIVTALLDGYGATLTPRANNGGAVFEITF